MATAGVVRALRAAHWHDASRQALLQMACDRIRSSGPPYTSVYAYMLHDGELVLEAHAGRDTEHVRIPVGAGVCGTAGAEKRDQDVPDGTAVGHYLGCNAFTRAGVGGLIRRADH